MTDDRTSSADPRPLLHDLAPRDDEERARAAEVERAAAESRVHRRSLPVLTTQFAESLPAWAAGLRADRVIGPVHDVHGLDVWFDVFHKVRHVRFVRSAGADPFLALPVRQVIFGGKGPQQNFQLGPGSFWIATRLLAVAAPGDAYSGLRISGGTLHFGNAVDISGDEVIVSEAVPCKVTLTLDPPETFLGIGPGADVRAAIFHPAKSVTFDVVATGATVTVKGASMLGLYGQQVELDPEAGAPFYLPLLNRVVVPLAPKQTMFTVKGVQSASFHPSGSAPITGGGWALSAARIDPADLGEASGVGALMIDLNAGLEATWTGQSEPASLGSTRILLDDARLAVVCAAAYGYAVEQHPLLPAPLARSHIAMTWGRTFPLSYFAQASGAEAILTVAALSVSFEKPVDVRGEPVAVNTKAALVIFLETMKGNLLRIQADLIPDSTDPGLGFGLTNAVLRSSPPVAFLLIAAWDGKLLFDGDVAIAYGLMSIIPSLPDPYATNVRPKHGGGSLGRLMSIAHWSEVKATVELILPPGMALPAAMLAGFEPGAGDEAGETFAFEKMPRLILLDLSTNVSQFGVALRAAPHHRTVAVEGLDLAIDGNHMVLLTLPAVQWEPVECEPVPDDANYPKRLTFDNSGVPALIDVPTVKLVPVRPDAALGAILDNFAHVNPNPANARFTLPFGMIANAVLSKGGAHVKEERPKSADGLEGGRQLRIDASGSALPGFTFQLSNASPGPRSILGPSVTGIFNGYLGSGGTNPLVPVTRVDLSGFGESLFSSWINTDDSDTEVSKAEFTVMIGRTAHEVVQVRSILLPYRVPVIRTITMERRNHGVVTRHDSGWVAAGDGKYGFEGIVTHPGVVTKMTDVTHIRETGDRVTKDGIEFAAVYYQGDLSIEGASSPVPVKHHFGYVKIGVLPLTPAIYAKLIAEAGPLCGPLDATIHIGNGAQAMRLHRVGVGVTQTDSGPEFVMTAWGSLAFPAGGEWSVLYAQDGAAAPQPVPQDEGLPIIRAGSSKPYRFADPADLAHESLPARDYGILHATGTQRAFFRRPKIEHTDLTRIVSTQKPVIADPYILATSQGAFPLQSVCIPFPSKDWALKVGPGGSYKLEMQSSTFPAGVGRRTTREAGSVKSDLDYSDSKVTYEVDTDKDVPWRFELTKAKKIMSHSSMGDVITFTASVNAQAGKELNFADTGSKMGGALEIVQDLLNILEDFGFGLIGIFRMAVTGEYSFSWSLHFPLMNEGCHDLQFPPSPAEPRFKMADTNLTIEFEGRPFVETTTFEFGGMPMFAIEMGWFIVIVVRLKIILSTEDGTTYELVIGYGIAYEQELGEWITLMGVFHNEYFAIWGATAGWGVGFLVRLSASIVPIISIAISVEGVAARITAHPGKKDETVFIVAKIVLAFELTLFLFFSVKVESESEYVERVRGELSESELPDVV